MKYEMPLTVLARINSALRVIVAELWPEIEQLEPNFTGIFDVYNKDDYRFSADCLIVSPNTNDLVLEILIIDIDNYNIIDDMYVSLGEDFSKLLNEKLIL